VVLNPSRGDTKPSISSYYLGPRHAGIPLALDPSNPLPFGKRDPRLLAEEQEKEFELIGQLNSLASVQYPDDQALRARIRGYELAFKMQATVPEALGLASEKEEIKKLYGLDAANTRSAGERLLAARRAGGRGG